MAHQFLGVSSSPDCHQQSGGSHDSAKKQEKRPCFGKSWITLCGPVTGEAPSDETRSKSDQNCPSDPH